MPEFSIPDLIARVREKFGKKPTPVAEPIPVARPVSLEVEIPSFVASGNQVKRYADALTEAIRTGKVTAVDLTKPEDPIKIILQGE